MVTATEPRRRVGVVLAGGRSSRMGRDKAMLSWHGKPLLEHQMALLRAAGMQEIMVSGYRPDHQGIPDPLPHAGPLGGIAGIAAVCEDAQLLIVPVDMPRLSVALLERLRDARPDSGSVHFADHVLPLRLRLDAHCRAVLDELLANPDERARSLRALTERVGVKEIPLDPNDSARLLDCNTEETWREANHESATGRPEPASSHR